MDADGATAYLFGGRGSGGASSEVWAYDLATDDWSQIAADGPRARFGHTATWVPDVGLVVWSGQAGSEFFADIWAFNPQSAAWTELPALGAVPDARYGSCASIGPDGEMWISHGFTSSGRFDDTRSYNFDTDTWTDRTPAGEVPIERCLHDCFWSPDGRLILYAGQTNGRPALSDIWAYDTQAGAWTSGPDPAPPARQLYALAVGPERTLVFGGASLEGEYLSDSWSLDPATLDLAPIDGLPSEPPGRAGATLISDAERSRVLLFGGRNGDGHLADVWEIGQP